MFFTIRFASNSYRHIEFDVKILRLALFLGLFIGCSEKPKDNSIIPLIIPCQACDEGVAKKTVQCLKCGHPVSDSLVAYKVAVDEDRKLNEELRNLNAKRQNVITLRVPPLIKKREDFVTDNDLDMIWVEPGSFKMGSPTSESGRNEDETQVHLSITKGFYLGKYEVTQAQWEGVMGSHPSFRKSEDRPVEKVSWSDAVEFCKKLTEIEMSYGRVPKGMAYQLPTEAEWEYACRAGTATAYSWGDSINSSQSNYGQNVRETKPVGEYLANPWGFYDMHGNVWEWCADRYGDYPIVEVTDPTGPAEGWRFVKRGGSWRDPADALRSARRLGLSYRHKAFDSGFRVVFKAEQ